jgi:hypothetical protein
MEFYFFTYSFFFYKLQSNKKDIEFCNYISFSFFSYSTQFFITIFKNYYFFMWLNSNKTHAVILSAQLFNLSFFFFFFK